MHLSGKTLANQQLFHCTIGLIHRLVREGSGARV
jgi:hypothetical protein